MDNETIAEQKLKSIGGMLLLARTEAGFSQEDIAKKLHLSKSFIQYLENDEFARLGQNAVFIRGYVRSYANLVKVPEKTIIQLLDANNIRDTLTDKTIFIPTRKQISARDKRMRWLTYVIVILFLSLIFIWWHSQIIMHHHKALTGVKSLSANVTTSETKPVSTDGAGVVATTTAPIKPINQAVSSTTTTDQLTTQLHVDN